MAISSFYFIKDAIPSFDVIDYFLIEINRDILIEIKASKKITRMDKNSAEYTVQYRYRPRYNYNVVRAIKKVASELLSTALCHLISSRNLLCNSWIRF